MRGLFRRHNKKTWIVSLVGMGAVLLIGGGAYAALGGPLRPQSSSDIELQRGLVGWWKLDGSAQDSTPYRNSATLVNTPPTVSDREGKPNGAYSFNGTGQGLNIPGSAMPTTALTISMWVYQTAWANWYDLASINYGTLTTQTGWDLYSDTNGAVAFGLEQSGGSQSRAICSNGIMSLNKWHHLVGSFDGTTVRAYVDGVACGTTASYSGSPLTNTSVLKIGERAQGTTHYVDDIRVYNRALTGAEVKALDNQYDSAVQAASGEKGLMGWWKLDGNAKDSTPNRNNGTVNGPTLTADRKGRANSAYNFPGSGTNNISLGNSTAFNSPEVTMAAWIHPTALGGTPEIMAKEMQYKYRINSSGQVCVLVSGNGSAWAYNGCPTAIGIIVAGNWYHVAVTISSSGNSVTVYVNGAQVGTGTLGTTITGYNTNTMYLGAYNSGGAEPFIGDIDDARFYNRALSAAEIQNIASSYDSQINLNSSPTNTIASGNINQGLVGYWNFDGNAKDSTPYRNNGTVNGATLTTDRKSVASSAYGFNGTSSYISIPGQTALGTSNQAYTIAGWFNANATSGNLIWMSSGSNGGSWCLAAATLSAGKLTANSWDGSLKTATGATTISTGTWYQFAETWDSANGLRVFLNGSLDGSVAQSTYSASSATNYIFPGLQPSVCSTGNTGWFNGSIDEVRVYNRALSASEVQALYASYN